MSILQEYAEIRREIGEEKYWHIEAFLEKHPNYFLSDVYYKEHVWKEFEVWEKENFKEVLPKDKEKVIEIVNSIFTKQFDFIPLYKVRYIVNELIEKGVINVKEEPKENLF